MQGSARPAPRGVGSAGAAAPNRPGSGVRAARGRAHQPSAPACQSRCHGHVATYSYGSPDRGADKSGTSHARPQAGRHPRASALPRWTGYRAAPLAWRWRPTGVPRRARSAPTYPPGPPQKAGDKSGPERSLQCPASIRHAGSTGAGAHRPMLHGCGGARIPRRSRCPDIPTRNAVSGGARRVSGR